MFKVNSLASDLKGKSVLVTASSRGIGRAIALKLASLGANIVINYVEKESAALAVVAEAEKLGVRAIAVKADISKVEEAKHLVDVAVSTYGPLFALINNAGVFFGNPIEKETDENLDIVIGVNVKGTFYVTRAAVPHLEDGGAIVNISSVLTKHIYPHASVYTMSKGAVEAFTRALAVELAPRRISVNTVSPGYTVTGDFDKSMANVEAYGIAKSKLGRLGVPDDIAEAVAFFTVPRSKSWVTGTNMMSSGGVGTTF